MSDAPSTLERDGDFFGLLSDDLIDACFSFLGNGHFLFVATTCKRFNNDYFKDGVRNKETFYENAALTISCAKLCLKESSDKKASLEKIAGKAGKHGRLDVVKWIHGNKNVSSFCFLVPAAGSSQLQVLEWARKQGLFHRNKRFIRQSVAEGAAEEGQIDVLEFLCGHRIEFSFEQVCCCACRNGHVAVLDWMKERINLLQVASRDVYTEAASEGHINVLDWFHDNGFEVDGDVVVCWAFTNGDVQLLLWAWRHGMELKEYQYASISWRSDHYLPLLRGLLDASCPWINRIIDYARVHGNQRVVEWAVENGLGEQRV